MADEFQGGLVEQGYAATPATLNSWAVSGRSILESILDESHAPNDQRSLRAFSQTEIVAMLGQEHEKPLRKWVRTNVLPRHKRTQQEGRVRLSIDEVYEYMAALDLLPRRPGNAKPIRLMVGAYKGGSGKSSLSLHLAHYLGLRMWRVLVVDSDPQATLTKTFGLTPERVDDEYTMKPIFDAIEDNGPIPPLPYLDTHFPTLKLTPANMSLMHADISLAIAFREQKGFDFYKALDLSIRQVEDDFDIILIDTPPAFSMTSVTTIYAANGLILPMPAAVPDFAAAFDFCEAVGDLFGRVEEITGEKKVWDPVVVVHSKVDANQTSDIVRRLSSEVFGGNKIEEHVVTTAAVSNAIGEFKSVYEVTASTVDSRSLNRAREAYGAVGDRLVRIIESVWVTQALEAENG